ncbi:hypothetical protein PsYK624_172480 [Phanerochaete sordida]|uniref:Uncharacterized protein n=1 Tax=Phanerochaete sordida TaxID=48140 RepID=A0A9P3GTC8_9APHY|nr:hypothetical protein PsYK624_172480 [Phanerochaete sordida]
MDEDLPILRKHGPYPNLVHLIIDRTLPSKVLDYVLCPNHILQSLEISTDNENEDEEDLAGIAAWLTQKHIKIETLYITGGTYPVSSTAYTAVSNCTAPHTLVFRAVDSAAFNPWSVPGPGGIYEDREATKIQWAHSVDSTLQFFPRTHTLVCGADALAMRSPGKLKCIHVDVPGINYFFTLNLAVFKSCNTLTIRICNAMPMENDFLNSGLHRLSDLGKYFPTVTVLQVGCDDCALDSSVCISLFLYWSTC